MTQTLIGKNTTALPGTLYAEVATTTPGIKVQVRNVYTPKREALAFLTDGEAYTLILRASTAKRAIKKLTMGR